MLIHLSRIQRLYRSDEVETTALHDIELDIAQGEFLAIMGHQGAANPPCSIS